MFRKVRQASLKMCAPLSPEDYQVQPCEEVSPPKWNLGHTSWFFYRFILRKHGLGLPIDEAFAHLFNSYYHRAGLGNPRGRRGLMTRPTVEQVYSYRESVDERMEKTIATADDEALEELDFLTTVGKNHEQQHQELFYTEIKNIYHANTTSLRPAYLQGPQPVLPSQATEIEFIDFHGGTFEFGNTEGGWCWDNELAIHRALLGDFALSDRLVTNREFLDFMRDAGYSNPLFWLSDGWLEVERRKWSAPLYWENLDGKWWIFTLGGMRELDLEEPVCHVSFYEACAFANWKSKLHGDFSGCRLPAEREWEHAARVSGARASPANFAEEGRLHPAPVAVGDRVLPTQMLGDLWEWTSSHYEPYPGFREFADDLSEYNGKFMNNQRVLRGGSCATPGDHIRLSYRNFWPPATRFQFTGIRLAKDL